MAKRTDANQAVIVKALRQVPGVRVAVTSALGDGFPDLVCAYKKVNYLFEVKDAAQPPSGRKLTSAELEFHETWTGQVDVIMYADDALRIMGVLK